MRMKTRGDASLFYIARNEQKSREFGDLSDPTVNIALLQGAQELCNIGV